MSLLREGTADHPPVSTAGSQLRECAEPSAEARVCRISYNPHKNLSRRGL